MMVLGPARDVWQWLKAHNPGSPFKKRRLSFMTCHYIYIIAVSIVASILMYPAGGIAYIDALLFATGAATQSGLNTVDVNQLKTEQQVVIYFTAMIANPIFINTFVVFVRLYWFEKRFQHIVREARNFRRTRSKSRTNTLALDEKDGQVEERGVDGRDIRVLHENRTSYGPVVGPPFQERPKHNTGVGSLVEPPNTKKESLSSSDQATDMSPIESPQPRTPFTRDITFADEVVRSPKGVTNEERIPHQMSHEQQIAFLENQRNPKDQDALRIPGPRDFDKGDVPKMLSRAENREPESRTSTSSAESTSDEDVFPTGLGGHKLQDPSNHRTITIDESNAIQSRHNRDLSIKSKLSLRLAATNRSEKNPSFERFGSSGRPQSLAGTFPRMMTSSSREKDPMPYFSWQPTIGRNSAFIDLTEEQREELGGIEYRSLKTLATLLVSYFLFFHLLGIVTLLPWILRTDTWGSVVDADGQSRTWWGIFTPATCFNDLGYTLTPDSFISFNTAVLPLLLGTFLIVIGNTGFPCMLRLLIWLFTKIVPENSGIWEEFKFLLDHPRRCFTLLFPSEATWWLFWILVLLNGIDLLFFVILDLNDSAVTSVSPGFRVLDGLFQAASTRTSGTNVVNLALLHPGIQVSYLIMMYISVFPIAISVRRTNVYEEKSLGIYGGKAEDDEDEREPSYVGAHLRRQLSFDLWFIFLGLFIIAIAEGQRLQDPTDVAFSLFACLFEIVSAYGTVGLSLGYPTVNSSFCTEFGTVSKLVIAAMQIRGRHRGLPYDLDRAILLPSESLHKKEDQDATKRAQRRMSSGALDPAGNLISPFSRTGTGISTGRSHTDQEVERVLSDGSSNSRARIPGHGGLGKVMAGLAHTSEAVKGHE